MMHNKLLWRILSNADFLVRVDAAVSIAHRSQGTSREVRHYVTDRSRTPQLPLREPNESETDACVNIYQHKLQINVASTSELQDAPSL